MLKPLIFFYIIHIYHFSTFIAFKRLNVFKDYTFKRFGRISLLSREKKETPRTGQTNHEKSPSDNLLQKSPLLKVPLLEKSLLQVRAIFSIFYVSFSIYFFSIFPGFSNFLCCLYKIPPVCPLRSSSLLFFEFLFLWLVFMGKQKENFSLVFGFLT